MDCTTPVCFSLRHKLNTDRGANNRRTIFKSSPCFFAAASNGTVTAFQMIRWEFCPLQLRSQAEESTSQFPRRTQTATIFVLEGVTNQSACINAP